MVRNIVKGFIIIIVALLLIVIAISILVPYEEQDDITMIKSYPVVNILQVKKESPLPIRNFKSNIDGTYEKILFIAIFIRPGDFERRKVIRETMFVSELFQRNFITAKFFIGKVEGQPQITQRIEIESRQYGDLIILDYIDSYEKLSLKTFKLFEYCQQYCSSYAFIMKLDDDVYVNLYYTINLLVSKHPSLDKYNFYMGAIDKNAIPIRNTAWKYYLTEAEFPWDVCPDYAVGPGYILNEELVKEIISMPAQLLPRIRLEDVMVGLWLKNYLENPTITKSTKSLLYIHNERWIYSEQMIQHGGFYFYNHHDFGFPNLLHNVNNEQLKCCYNADKFGGNKYICFSKEWDKL